jgi:hypothetical protein
MRLALIATLLLMGAATPAMAQVTFSIRLGAFPSMVAIPGYPVYYAPGLDYNYFFYDGLYWVYQDENWYSSAWYDGPWDTVNPFSVPVFMLQVPVRYYRRPPSYFRGWQGDNAPHWGDHWGRSWSQQRSGWDRRPDGPAPAPARLPEYQRQYAGSKYPAPEQQRQLQQSHGMPAPRAVQQPQRAAPGQRSAPQPQQRPAPEPRSTPPQQQRPAPEPRSAPQRQERPSPERRTAPQQQQRPAPEQRNTPPRPQRAAPERRTNGQARDRDNNARDPHNSP